VLVSLGLGSVIASAFEAAPWLAAVGRQKAWMFAAAGAVLIIDYWVVVVRPRQMNCAPGEICHIDSPTMRANRVVFWISVAIYAASVTFTYATSWWLRMLS